jgi:hypothetical protein
MALFMLDYFPLRSTPLGPIQPKNLSPLKKYKKKNRKRKTKNITPGADCDRNLILYTFMYIMIEEMSPSVNIHHRILH